ncbi:hypothetical protein QLX67_08245 [Balneolaceae bacterium ANBcel3]|nr:hypothetical protein [Balneolaceae bacterium ANBcel3]
MKILKIAGIIVGSFVGVFVLIFYLYPLLNQNLFEEWMDNEDEAALYSDAWTKGGLSEEELDRLKEEMDNLQATNKELLNTVDSLMLVNEELKLEIEEWENMEDFLPVAQSATDPVDRGSTQHMDDEEFSERVKSLLNLDEDELAPILRQMDQGQLVRLYRNAGNIQREKMLRSLEPARAASLMSEVML